MSENEAPAPDETEDQTPVEVQADDGAEATSEERPKRRRRRTAEKAEGEASGDGVAEEKPAKEKRGRGGARKADPRKPSFKDWLRVIRSQSSTCENVRVHLIINTATNVASLVTQAPKAEGSEELEPERVQVFRITGHEVVDIPESDAPAAEPAAE